MLWIAGIIKHNQQLSGILLLLNYAKLQIKIYILSLKTDIIITHQMLLILLIASCHRTNMKINMTIDQNRQIK